MIMYTYIKKALMVISLLTLPSMNTVVKAMEEDNQPTNTCQSIVVWKDTNEILNSHQAMVVLKDEEVSNADHWLWRGVKNTTMYTVYKYVDFGVKNPGLTFVATTCALVCAAEACRCICLGDWAINPKDLDLGEVGGNLTCQVTCAGNGYFKGFTCKSIKRDDLP